MFALMFYGLWDRNRIYITLVNTKGVGFGVMFGFGWNC